VGEVYNIGSDEEITILELAERIRELSGSESPIEFVPYSEAFGENFEDMPRRVPSLEKIRAAVGHDPRYGLDDVLEAVIEFHGASTTVVV